MEIIYLPIDEITQYLNNAKKHPAEQVEQIKASIQEFGMNDPIAVYGGANLIVEGHGRYLACKELGMKTVPVIRLDDLTDEQRKAYALVHNKLAMETGFDFEKLERELSEINKDLSIYGLQREIDNFEFDGISSLFDEDEEKKVSDKPEGKFCTCPFCGERVKR